jgi:phospholipid transport system substrate-binding protein
MKNQILRPLHSMAQIVLIFSFVFLTSSPLLSAKGNLTNPSAQVDEFHSVLLLVMKGADQLGVLGRYRAIEPVLTKVFHLKAMMQIASGSFWKKLSDEDQIKLLNTFTRLTIATYAAQFDGYSGQVFKTIGTKPGPQDTTLVETQIVNADSSSVALTYVFRKIKGQWRILDVLLDTGISELARKRSEYRKALMSGGAEALLLMMNSKTSSLLIN